MPMYFVVSKTAGSQFSSHFNLQWPLFFPLPLSSSLPQPPSFLHPLSLTTLHSLSSTSTHPSSLSFSLSISSSLFTNAKNPRRLSLSPIKVKVRAIAAEKKKVLIVNTNSGGHAIIGFYFAKELLGCGHEVTIMTVGEESSDKMKKPPFNRFSVKIFKI